MKKVFISNENPAVELVKSCIYSFQVLIVGVAIPVLFMIGISNGNTNKSTEEASPSIQQANNLTQLSPKKVAALSLKGI